KLVTGVQTCALPIYEPRGTARPSAGRSQRLRRLPRPPPPGRTHPPRRPPPHPPAQGGPVSRSRQDPRRLRLRLQQEDGPSPRLRSEERRVGKECSSD